MSYIEDFQQQIADAEAAKVQQEADNAAQIAQLESEIQALQDQLTVPLAGGFTLVREGDQNILSGGGTSLSFGDVIFQQITDKGIEWLGTGGGGDQAMMAKASKPVAKTPRR